MIKRLILTFVFLLFSFAMLWGAQGNMGMGAIIGSPTGLSLKYFMNKNNAIDCALAWSLKENERFRFHVDYLWHNYKFFNKNLDIPITLYYGGGLRGIFDSDFRFGLRGSIGTLYWFKEAPIDIFFEIAPSMDLLPATDFSLDAAIGARFFFKIK